MTDASSLERTMSTRLKAYCQRQSEDLKRFTSHEAERLRHAWMMRHAIQIHVQEGQRYEKVFKYIGRNPRFKVRGCPTVWEVQSVSSQFLSLPHARLINQQDPCDIRIVSCNEIEEGRSFKLITEPEEQQTLHAEAA
jgi:hypothetical protein